MDRVVATSMAETRFTMTTRPDKSGCVRHQLYPSYVHNLCRIYTGMTALSVIILAISFITVFCTLVAWTLVVGREEWYQ